MYLVLNLGNNIFMGKVYIYSILWGIMSLAIEGIQTLNKSETEKLRDTIMSIPLGKYQDKTQILIKLEDISKSGMTRWYNVYFVSEHYELLRLSWSISEVYKEQGNGNQYDKKREALKVKGCGFSGAHKIASDLSYMLFSDDNKIGYREF